MAAFTNDMKSGLGCSTVDWYSGYFIGDVGDDLHRLAQIIATALLLYHGLTDASGRDIVGACGGDVGEIPS